MYKRQPPHLLIPHLGPHPSMSGDELTGATNASFSPQVPLQSQSRWLRLPPAHTNEQLRPCHHPTNLARSSPLTTHLILRPNAEYDLNHIHAANLRKSKDAYTVNKSRPAGTHYWPFPTTRLEFFCFSSDVHKSFFFLLREEILLGEGGWMEGCPVAAGEWRLRAVAASPWVFPAWWGRAS